MRDNYRTLGRWRASRGALVSATKSLNSEPKAGAIAEIRRAKVVSSVAVGLAGDLYGYEFIPIEWRKKLIKGEYIDDMCQIARRNMFQSVE